MFVNGEEFLLRCGCLCDCVIKGGEREREREGERESDGDDGCSRVDAVNWTQ